MNRDNQRSRVYRAERGAFPDAPLMTLGEVKARVRNITSTSWWKDHRGFPVEVRDGRGRRRPGASPDYITIPCFARLWWVVLHELAHTLAIKERHGLAFCRLYLDMVSRFKGRTEAEVLRLSFVKHNVAH